MKHIKEEYRELPGEELARICAKIALDTKAKDIKILDVRGLTTFTEFFVLLSGTSTRHVRALAEAIEEKLRSKRIRTSRAEGLREGIWVLLDFDDVVVHIFYREERDFYDLEGLWSDAREVVVEGAP